MGARGAATPHPDAMPVQKGGLDGPASYTRYLRGSAWYT